MLLRKIKETCVIAVHAQTTDTCFQKNIEINKYYVYVQTVIIVRYCHKIVIGRRGNMHDTTTTGKSK